MGIREDNPYIGMLREYKHFFEDKKRQRDERYLSPDGKVCFFENPDGTWDVRIYQDAISENGVNTICKSLGPFNDLISAISMYETLGRYL